MNIFVGEYMINLINEIVDLVEKYDLNLDDMIFTVNNEIMEKEEFLEKFNICYDNSWGTTNFEYIQLIIDDYTWFERTSYDGCEKFILKAHPLLSTYENQESHTEYFYR